MLEKSDQINWDSLGAPQLPNLLRDLGSNAQEIRLAAYDSLIDVLVPWAVTDPGLYWGNFAEEINQPAIPFAIPFLIELLAEPSIQDKARILWLLHEIATYADNFYFVPEEERNAYMVIALKLLKAINLGSAVYVELGSMNNDKETQEYAGYLLRLLDALNNEHNP